MKQQLSLVAMKDRIKTATSKGLAPIVCYEPWFPRFLESIKQSIHDGHPVLVRLHSAASYPIDSEIRYVNDLESHAVLIVGYDDVKKAVAVIDPWNKEWGGIHGGRRWISYDLLSLINVDGSLGVAMCLAPLEINSALQWDATKNLSIKLQVGFYVPRGTVMDRDSWKLTEINVNCTLPDSWGVSNISHTVHGNWIVGDIVDLSIPLINSPKCDGVIYLHLNAQVKGVRPYDFIDNLEIYDSLIVESPQVSLNATQENCAFDLVL